jgi:dynein heavy chain
MIEHLGRISRIVLKPRGHGLLVSLGGHGRGVLTKLATFLNDHTLFRAEFSRSYGRTEWLDEMKGLFKRAGIDDERHVFALTATEAAGCPGAIEDVSSITNSGEIPNLFSSDDLEEIRAEVSKVARPGVGVDPLALFAERCRANVHVMLSISPAGDALREHLRLYPALGHCTTIDWFLPWPEEALSSVAIAQLLASPDLGRHVGALMASGQESHAGGASLVGTGGRDRAGPLAELARVFVGIHRCVEEAAVRYEQETGRAVYLTPARCKQALALFAELLTQKAANVDEERHQYLTGVRKL